jgi:surfactin synthase thioesterase subunit
MRIDPGRWTVTPDVRPDAALRLVCFHHAGGGAFGFRPWTPLLHRDVELLAVQLPGRENRFGEPPARHAEEVVAAVANALRYAPPKPYAVFGHSLGARLSLSFARHAIATGDVPAPLGLIASGARPPRDPQASPVRPKPPVSDDELVETLSKLGGTPPSLLADRALLNTFLPTLRADMALNEGLRRQPRQPLDLPILVLGGLDDLDASPAQLADWQGFSRHPVQVRMFPGGHFFTQTALVDVMTAINARLRTLVGRAAGRLPNADEALDA